MRKEFKFKKFAVYLFITWTVGIIGCGIFLRYVEMNRGLNLPYFHLWWFVPLLVSYVGLALIYKKLEIRLTDDFIAWPYPLKNINGERLPLEEISRVNIKKKGDEAYITSINDVKHNNYKISFFIGTKNAEEMKKHLIEALDRKGLDVEINEL